MLNKHGNLAHLISLKMDKFPFIFFSLYLYPSDSLSILSFHLLQKFQTCLPQLPQPTLKLFLKLTIPLQYSSNNLSGIWTMLTSLSVFEALYMESTMHTLNLSITSEIYSTTSTQYLPFLEDIYPNNQFPSTI